MDVRSEIPHRTSSGNDGVNRESGSQSGHDRGAPGAARESGRAGPTPATIRRLCRALVIAALAVAYIHIVASTWQRWGDIIIDCGRELDAPKQLLAGKVLYKDVRYWYGPLAPYTNALLYRLCGVHVSTLTTAGLVVAAVTMLLGYRIVRLFTGRLAAVAVAVAFLYVAAFGLYVWNNIFNFAFPYAYAATYGMALAAASVFFLLRHAVRRRRRDFLLSCLFLALTALCKVEVLVAAGVAHGVFLVGWLPARRPGRLMYLLGYLAVVAAPACIYAYFYARTGSALWTDNLWLPGNVAAGGFTLKHSGFLDVARSLEELGSSLAAMAGCFVLFALVALVERRVRRSPACGGAWRGPAFGVLVFTGSALAGTACYFLGAEITFRSLPVLLLVPFVVFTWRWLLKAEARATQVPAMVLYAFGLGALARMVLRCGAEHYGFYLLVPGLFAFGVLWCHHLPAWLKRPPAPPALSAYACGVAMLAVITWTHADRRRAVAAEVYGPGPTPFVRTAYGTMPCRAHYVGSVDEAVRFLEEEPPTTTVIVFPEGAAIAFLAGCTNPLGVHTYLPIDFSGSYDEARMVERVAESDPDYVLITARNVREFGAAGFGIDYGRTLGAWLEENYHVARRYQTRGYSVTVLGRR
jgi:hypothetical protein